MATGSVSVRMAMVPATMMVAPNSPMALAQESTPGADQPAARERQVDGEERPDGRGAQGAGDGLVAARHLVEGRLHEAHGHAQDGDELGQHDAGEGEHELDGMRLDPLPERDC